VTVFRVAVVQMTVVRIPSEYCYKISSNSRKPLVLEFINASFEALAFKITAITPFLSLFVVCRHR